MNTRLSIRTIAVVFAVVYTVLADTVFVSQPGLMAYWSFDSIAGKTYYDVTGHGYNAISTGWEHDVKELLPGARMRWYGIAPPCPAAVIAWYSGLTGRE